MPPLSARTGLPCLFCAVAARPRAQRLVPRLYAVHTFSTSNASRRENYRKGGALRISTNQSMYRLDLTGKHPPKATLHSTVREKLNKIKAEFIDPEYLQTLHLTREEFDREWLTFERSISAWVKEANPEAITLANEAKRGKSTLEKRLRLLFFSQSIGGRFTAAELENQRKVADLQYPSEWYPATREIKRTIHLHVGPTNSGKTYHALKRLEEAESGIYLGPLRLLAYEVYSRLNAKGRPCALLTGDEQRIPQDQIPTMFSCTVEMAPLNRYSEVAVIDEIQMINHSERGWAWTQAFLGLKAKEIHLCGEARTVPLIRHLCGLLGDDVHVHEYERLTPLKIAPKSLRGSLQSLEKGDCIVAFSVLGIHALRREIEKKTGKRCAIVYGSLPPETRAQQARLFNDPDNDYDFLVASDAIGMGLNLAIKRVIFESTMKNNGVNYVPLQISEIKQIAGRAGRYRTAHQAITEDRADASVANDSAESIVDLGDGETTSPQLTKKPENQVVGYATTLENIDYQYLKSAMEQEPEPILQAGLAPPSIVVERFASYFPPGTPFSYILLRLNEVTKVDSRFFLCSLRDQLAIADAIHKVRNLSIVDRNIICACPANMRDSLEKAFVQNLAACIADGKSGHLLDLKNLPLEVLDEKPVEGRGYLSKLEQLHKLLVCYLWLSYRYPNVFITRTLASRAKEMTEYAIESALVNFSTTEKFRRRLAERREKAFRKAHGRGKNDTTPPEGQQISQSTDMPKEAVEILTDVRSFASGPPPSDDMGEYPEETKMENSTMKIRG